MWRARVPSLAEGMKREKDCMRNFLRWNRLLIGKAYSRGDNHKDFRVRYTWLQIQVLLLNPQSLGFPYKMRIIMQTLQNYYKDYVKLCMRELAHWLLIVKPHQKVFAIIIIIVVIIIKMNREKLDPLFLS